MMLLVHLRQFFQQIILHSLVCVACNRTSNRIIVTLPLRPTVCIDGILCEVRPLHLQD
jgi:hypothetical protein